jgi:hypothetical protein
VAWEASADFEERTSVVEQMLKRKQCDPLFDRTLKSSTLLDNLPRLTSNRE